jgi:3-oxoacyl-[acyl-carrier-protein] synthase II
MSKKRIVITGMGVSSCFGMDVEKFYASLLAGKSGVAPISAFPCEEYPTRFAGQVQGFDPDGYLDKKQARRVDPNISYAIVAGKKAVEMAGLSEPEDCNRYGVIIGSGMGGMHAFSDGVNAVFQKGFNKLTPFFVPYIITNMGGALLSMELGYRGPNYSISTACATGTHSIIAAARHIERGEADVMIAGGTEACINQVGVAGFVACKALSTHNEDPTKACRPWDKSRDGFVMGEGCGVIVLESLEHAKRRGATILGEYHGGYVNCDAYHMTNPIEDGSGVGYCMEKAIEQSGVEKSRINYINAHATSTPVGDMCEVRAIKRVFGSDTDRIKVNATKSMTGHCLGAAGGIEAVATTCAIKNKELHPTINHHDPEEELGNIDVCAEGPVKLDVDVAISNSFGFGGHNAVLVMGRYDD